MLDNKNSASENSASQTKLHYHTPEFLGLGAIAAVIENTSGTGSDVSPLSTHSSAS